MPPARNREMTDREILLEIHSRLGGIEAAISLWRWIFGSTVIGGVAWLTWLTVSLTVLR